MRHVPTLLALAIITATGTVYGTWTGRWTDSPALEATAKRLARVPRTVGDWEGSDNTIDRHALEQAGIVGYVARRYENRRNGRALNVLLVCGRPGPIAVHRPEICYGGVGYEVVGDRTALKVDDSAAAGTDEFWAINLERPNAALTDGLRILYGWSADGSWQAAQRPRIEFAGAPALFKLYVVRAVAEKPSASGDEPEADFLRQFLPLLRQAVFASAASPNPKAGGAVGR